MFADAFSVAALHTFQAFDLIHILDLIPFAEHCPSKNIAMIRLRRGCRGMHISDQPHAHSSDPLTYTTR